MIAMQCYYSQQYALILAVSSPFLRLLVASRTQMFGFELLLLFLILNESEEERASEQTRI